MEKDNILKLEEIRKTVKLETINPEKLVKTWNDIFGQETSVRREKFVNNGGEMGAVKDSVLEEVKVTPVENLTFITWKGVDGQPDKYLAIDREFLMGVQNYENGTKSLILVHSRQDEKTGKDRQTTRRFTPINK